MLRPIFAQTTFDTIYIWIADGQSVLSLSAERVTGNGSVPQENGPYYATYSQRQIPTGLESAFIPGISLGLYPNPVQDQFHISGINSIVSISDISGNAVDFSSMLVSSGIISVNPVAKVKGFYIAQVIDLQGIKRAMKFSVQ